MAIYHPLEGGDEPDAGVMDVARRNLDEGRAIQQMVEKQSGERIDLGSALVVALLARIQAEGTP